MADTPLFTASLTYWAHRAPDTPALECGTETVTWRELADQVETLAAALEADGVRPGDRVGYLCENSIDALRIFLATLAVRAVVVPLNIRLTTSELRYIFEDAGISAVMVDPIHRAPVDELRHELDLTIYWSGEGRPDWARPLVTSPVSPVTVERLRVTSQAEDSLAVISYTSGTTGRPKGAMLSHGNLVAAASSFALTEGYRTDDVSLLVLPLAFTGSLVAGWFPAYYSGSLLVLHPKFEKHATMAELMRGRVSVLPTVPVVFEQLMAMPEFVDADLSHLRVAKAGGAPPAATTIATWAARGIPIGQGYGMTESTGVGTSVPTHAFEAKAGSAGIVNYGTEIRIMVNGVEAPANEVGEMWIQGPTVMMGYWGKERESAETVVDGWLHTGDLARRDEDGYIWIAGRAKEMILSGGLNVYPGEIERVIGEVPGVLEVAVIGIQDEKWAEVPVAIVVTDDASLDAETLRERCRAELAGYKIPKHIVVQQSALPRTMSGKVSKKDLRAGFVGA